jgi:hypothetical protein
MTVEKRAVEITKILKQELGNVYAPVTPNLGIRLFGAGPHLQLQGAGSDGGDAELFIRIEELELLARVLFKLAPKTLETVEEKEKPRGKITKH